MKKILILAALLLAMPALAARKAPATVAAFRDAFMAAYWQRNPDAAVYAGYYKYADRLPAPGARERSRNLAFDAQWLRRLQAVDSPGLPVQDRVDLALIRTQLEGSRWAITEFKDYAWDPSGYNVAGSFGLLLGTSYAPLETRLRTVSRRLEQVPAYYAAARANIGRPTLEHTELAIAQNKGALGVFGEDFGKQVEGSALAAAEKDRLTARAARARAAIQGYIGYLEGLHKDLKAHGGRSFRIGRKLYEQGFAYGIQADCSAEELNRRALAEKEKLHARMDDLTRQLWPAHFGSEPQPADRLARIGRMVAKLSDKHVAADQFVPEIRRQIPVLEKWVTDHHLVDLDPGKPLVVREAPEYARGVAGAGINAPGPYNPKADTYYDVTPLSGSPAEQDSSLREYNDYLLQILNIHEAVPGHYVQQLHANKAPSVVKSVFGNSAMIEGWAVYAERMMLESGYGGDTPEMWLMYSKWSLRVVCNTILDYGIHVNGMTEAEARRLMVTEAFQEQAEADEKWHRAQISSVQLCSYFAGYSAIYDLRETLKARRGAAFDLHDFHEELLDCGSAPVKFIRQIMMER